jgi:hypothetical protein
LAANNLDRPASLLLRCQHIGQRAQALAKEIVMNHPTAAKDSSAWILFVWLSFGVSSLLMVIGILNAPVDLWVRDYFIMGLFFVVGSTFTLAKTVRDNHEAQRMINRVVDAKTEKILSDYELRAS